MNFPHFVTFYVLLTYFDDTIPQEPDEKVAFTVLINDSKSEQIGRKVLEILDQLEGNHRCYCQVNFHYGLVSPNTYSIQVQACKPKPDKDCINDDACYRNMSSRPRFQFTDCQNCHVRYTYNNAEACFIANLMIYKNESICFYDIYWPYRHDTVWYYD